MPHLRFNNGDRLPHGYPATDLDVDDTVAAFLLGATHSDGSPVWTVGGVSLFVDETVEQRIAHHEAIIARVAEAQAADAAYAAAHSQVQATDHPAGEPPEEPKAHPVSLATLLSPPPPGATA